MIFEPMVYNWQEVREAVEMVKAFPWGRKLKKAEHFSNACELVTLYVQVNKKIRNSIIDTWYPEEYRRQAYLQNATGKELEKLRKNCERHIKNELNALGRDCMSGTVLCNFDL